MFAGPPITSPDTSLATIQSQRFFGELDLRVGDDVLGFGGESDEEFGASRALRERCEDVVVFDEGEDPRGAAGVLLDLLWSAFDPPVGDGGDEDRGVGGEGGFDRGGHVARGLYVDASYAGGCFEGDRAGDQGHARTFCGDRGGYREPLFSRGAVGDVAHRVDRLMSGARGDNDVGH